MPLLLGSPGSPSCSSLSSWIFLPGSSSFTSVSFSRSQGHKAYSSEYKNFVSPFLICTYSLHVLCCSLTEWIYSHSPNLHCWLLGFFSSSSEQGWNESYVYSLCRASSCESEGLCHRVVRSQWTVPCPSPRALVTPLASLVCGLYLLLAFRLQQQFVLGWDHIRPDCVAREPYLCCC